MSAVEATGLSDIDRIWAGDGSHLPGWFVDALAVPREDAFVTVGGAQVHYLRWGDRAKPGVLMAHGFLAHARCWAFIAPFLAADYHVVAYDLAGMGDSDARAGIDGDGRGCEMIAVAEASGLFDGPTRPVIIGHSFGAGVAVTALTTAPERFVGAIICDLMIMRPEALAVYWRGGRGSPGPAVPDGLHGLSFAPAERGRVDLEVLDRGVRARQFLGRMDDDGPPCRRSARSAGNRPRRAERALRHGFRGISARTGSRDDPDRRRAPRAPSPDAGRAARLRDGAKKHSCSLEIGPLNQSGISGEVLVPGGLSDGEFQLRKTQSPGSAWFNGFGMHHCDATSHAHQRRRRADCDQSNRG